jgi:hypothetical protein
MNIVVAKIRKILVSKMEKLVFHAEYGGRGEVTLRDLLILL